MSEPLAITIGPSEAERITLEVLGRERPADEDYWDGNWLVVDVHVRVGGFVAHAVTNLRADEFESFRRQLVAAYDAVAGVATFKTMENWLTVKVTCEKTGRVTVEGEFTDRPGMGNRLRFWLPDMDQTYLPALIDQLDACGQAYPVKGRSTDG